MIPPFVCSPPSKPYYAKSDVVVFRSDPSGNRLFRICHMAQEDSRLHPFASDFVEDQRRRP